MSGGRWDYNGFPIQEALREIAQDVEVLERFPKIASLLLKLGEVLYNLEHDLDWDLSRDAPIEDDKAFERALLLRLMVVISEAYGLPMGEENG